MQKFGKWLENFWYHYKWHTLITLFVVVVAAVCITQMVTKTEPDVTALYGGPAELTANQAHEVALALQMMLPEDFNGDGEKLCDLAHYMLMTEEQRREYLEQAQAAGNPVIINGSNLTQNQTNFATQLSIGDTVICLLDPVWYRTASENNAFVPLSTLLGQKPDYAVDDYCVRLCDTPFYSLFDAFSVFPEDTLLCVRTRSKVTSAFASDEKERLYQCQLVMFRAMMEYGG